METNAKYKERDELTVIYNNLSPAQKGQLLTIARVIDTTQKTALEENRKERDFK